MLLMYPSALLEAEGVLEHRAAHLAHVHWHGGVVSTVVSRVSLQLADHRADHAVEDELILLAGGAVTQGEREVRRRYRGSRSHRQRLVSE